MTASPLHEDVTGYEYIEFDTDGPVGLIRLNRPKALNALCAGLVGEVACALARFAKDDDIRAIVLTGSEKAFAAGADIKEMADKTFAEVYADDFLSSWECLSDSKKPVIAAVAGYALGGGCEMAMMCDFIIAADNAKFGQPEITIGTIPGVGGSQRLTGLIGKSKAMDMVLTGRQMDAEEAERAGLVSRVVPLDRLMDEAVAAAKTIAGFSPIAVKMGREAVNAALETPLAEGLRFERRLFHASFATQDRAEGMAAFVEKRKADFKGR